MMIAVKSGGELSWRDWPIFGVCVAMSVYAGGFVLSAQAD
jgi:hypothetical protein